MSEFSAEGIANMVPVPASLDSLGMKWVERSFHVAGDAVIKDCAGCGFPIDANNPRSYEVSPGGNYSHYGACCAPRGKKRKKFEKARRRLYGR